MFLQAILIAVYLL